jgi:linoleoyl-CoA desaturase
MRTRRITFGDVTPAGGSPFARELRAEVAAYFDRNGLSPHANAAMVVKTIAVFAILLVPYGLVMSQVVPPLAMLGLAVVAGLGMAGIGFCVAHDALHGAYTSSRRWNDLLGASLEILGGSRHFWRLTHNTIHHTYTNVPGVDDDLVSAEPLVRLAPGPGRRPYHRLQHLYSWALYSLATINWVFVKDFKYFAASKIGPFEDVRHPRAEMTRMFAFKAFHLLWALVLPLIVLDVAWWQVVLGYVAMNLTAGITLAVVFQLAHVVEGPAYPTPDETGRIPDDWLAHQIRTSADFAPGNPLATWFLGGLNRQIEHHAFPRVCHVHYPALAPIVERVCRSHGVPYRVHRTMRAAVASHFRLLKTLGHADELAPAPAAAPPPALRVHATATL